MPHTKKTQTTAREAYIAGRSAGANPKKSSGSSGSIGASIKNTQQNTVQQKAFDAGQAEKKREQSIKENKGIGGLSQRDKDQAKTIAQNTKKDPYNTLTRKEQIDAGYPKTGIETLKETTGIGIPSLTLQAIVGGANAFKVLLDKAFKPELKDFSNPNFLAVLNAEFNKGIEKGGLDKKDYLKKYGNLIDEAFENQKSSISSFNYLGKNVFDSALDKATANVKPGSGTQRITDPEGFYTGEQNLTSTGLPMMPQTTDGLENLARLDTKGLEGTNPDLVKMIFDARMQLNNKTKVRRSEKYPEGIQGLEGYQSDTGVITIPTGMRPLTQEELDKYAELKMEPPPYMSATTGLPQVMNTQDIGIMQSKNPTGLETLAGPSGPQQNFNYANMSPQFSPQDMNIQPSMGPQYINQGINDPRFAQYYQNLSDYYGYNA